MLSISCMVQGPTLYAALQPLCTHQPSRAAKHSLLACQLVPQGMASPASTSGKRNAHHLNKTQLPTMLKLHGVRLFSTFQLPRAPALEASSPHPKPCLFFSSWPRQTTQPATLTANSTSAASLPVSRKERGTVLKGFCLLNSFAKFAQHGLPYPRGHWLAPQAWTLLTCTALAGLASRRGRHASSISGQLWLGSRRRSSRTHELERGNPGSGGCCSATAQPL